MKQTTKNILGVAAIVLLSSGVAGLTTYKMLQKNMPADSTSAFNEMFQQNPNVRLASYNAGIAHLSAGQASAGFSDALRLQLQSVARLPDVRADDEREQLLADQIGRASCRERV